MCDRVLKRSNNQGSLESRMLGNLHVRFGVGAGVKLPRPHHASSASPELAAVSVRIIHLRAVASTETCVVWAGEFHPGPNPKPDVQVSLHPAFQTVLIIGTL